MVVSRGQKRTGRIMHLNSMSTFNIFGSVETRTVSLDSPVVIFTGYNGAGKSTLLGVLHSLLSVANGQEYQFPKTDWACSVKFTDGAELLHVKTARDLPSEFSPPTKRKPKKDSDVLKDYYESIQNDIELKADKKNLIVKREGEGRSAKSTNIMSIMPGKLYTSFAWPSSVLYGDEIISSKQEDIDSKKFEDLDIFSKKKNIDKTFFLLQTEFATQSKNNSSGDVTPELIGVIESTLSFMRRVGVEDNNELHAQLRMLESLRDSKLQSNPLLREANSFFASTNREVKVGANGFLYLQTAHGKLQWYDFSKGEKTLLCLLLVAHLAGDKSMIFLLDEPDLSLHIKWQRKLIPSLRTLAPNAQYIVATHSPAMVGRTEDEAVVNIGAISKG